MDYNTIGYLSYLPIVGFITIYVGKLCHNHGIIYVKEAIADEATAHAVNNMLLVGYYLVNLGYSVYALTEWNYLNTLSEVIAEVASQSGYIISLLALLHYINLLTLFLVRKFKLINQHKN